MNTSKLKIKQHLVEMNKAGKMLAHLPDTHWQKANKELLNKSLKSIENFTKEDIEIEEVQYVPERKVKIYTVCICDFIRYALVVDKDFNVEYHQLQWRHVD